MLSPAIKNKIEERFGQRIRYSKDCEILSISIEKICNKKISATTLKRMFGFAKNIEKPRIYTLDVLAAYIGFVDWSSVLIAFSSTEGVVEIGKTVDPFHLLQQHLLVMITTNNINIEKVKLLCEKYKSQKELISFIIELINYAGKTKNVLFLKEIFNLPFVYDHFKDNSVKGYYDSNTLYFIGQAVGLLLRSDNNIAKELIVVYSKSLIAQKVLVELFVDEDYLNGYYGELIDLYFKNKKLVKENLIFFYSLKYTQALQAKNKKNKKIWFDKLKKIKLDNNVHSIVIGRYLGICMSQERMEKDMDYYYFNQLTNLLSNYDYLDKIYLLNFCLRYLFGSNQTLWLLKVASLAENVYNNAQAVEKEYHALKMYNQVLIYIAHACFLKQNLNEAKKYFSKIDVNLFDAFRFRGLFENYSEVQFQIFQGN
jgi:hypothetical protein